MLIPGGDQIRSRMTLNISRVRKLVQTALAPKPQINPAIRNSLSGIKNMGQAPHVFPSRRISLQRNNCSCAAQLAKACCHCRRWSGRCEPRNVDRTTGLRPTRWRIDRCRVAMIRTLFRCRNFFDYPSFRVPAFRAIVKAIITSSLV
jgi:hypothetical protein